MYPESDFFITEYAIEPMSEMCFDNALAALIRVVNTQLDHSDKITEMPEVWSMCADPSSEGIGYGHAYLIFDGRSFNKGVTKPTEECDTPEFTFEEVMDNGMEMTNDLIVRCLRHPERLEDLMKSLKDIPKNQVMYVLNKTAEYRGLSI